MTEIQFHPVADIFPMMSSVAFDDLREDIAAHGLRESIWLHADGRIIDGRNRYRACLAGEVEPEFRTYTGPESDLVSFVVSLNLHRRHLTESQRSMVAGRIANMSRGGDRKTDQTANLPFDLDGLEEPVPPSISNSAAAEMLNVSERSVRSARKVQEQAIPELAAKVLAGDLPVSTAADIADAPEDEQREVLASNDKKEIRDRAKVIRLRRRTEREQSPPPASATGSSETPHPAPDDEALLGAIERRKPGATAEVARTQTRARWSRAVAGVADLPLLDFEHVAAVVTDSELIVAAGALADAQQWMAKVQAAKTAGLRLVGGQR